MAFQWTAHQFVGGALCLDFANTVIYPTDPERRHDRLASLADLESWLACALRHGPLDQAEARAIAAAPPGGAADRLERARSLRDAVDRLFRPVVAGAAPEGADLDRVVACYRAACQGATLRFGDEGLRLLPAVGQGRLDGLLGALAQSAMTLALSPEARRIKACANCGWLFVDRSYNGRRRWCDMRVCGNRAKARRHYERQRQA